MNHVWAFYITAACVFAAVAVVAWLWRLVSERARARQREADLRNGSGRREMEDERPSRPPLVHPCEICDLLESTDRMPLIVVSKLDRDPTGHRKLHGMLPMYVVKDEKEGPPRLCMHDKRAHQRRKEQFLANIRSRSAEFAAGVEAEIAAFEAGMGLAVAREERRRAQEDFQQVIEGRAAPQLPPAAAPGVHTVTLPPEPGASDE